MPEAFDRRQRYGRFEVWSLGRQWYAELTDPQPTSYRGTGDTAVEAMADLAGQLLIDWEASGA